MQLIMRRRIMMIMLSVIALSLHVKAQTDYYYYEGEKIPLTRNDNKVCVSIPREYDSISERIHANVNILSTVGDSFFDIIIISKSDYEGLTSMESWQEDAKSVIITSCYYTEKREEVTATPYLNVKLKKEDDLDLLNSYAQDYKLNNNGNASPRLPLWYILSITPESEKSSLECANELYESGDFASSVPDLASSLNLDDLTVVRLIPTEKTQISSVYYDLLGRRVDSPSGLTIVVTRYNDGSVRTDKKLFR